MRLATSICALALTAMTVSAHAASDKGFVEKAARGGLAEVQLGQLAQQKATNPEVKAMAQHIVQGHQKANQELQQMAQAKGITIPTNLDRKHEKTHEKLSKLSGAEFDKEYVKAMVKDHKDDIEDFEKQAKRGEDPELKNWAAQTMPVLQEHLKMAQALEEQLKNQGKNR